MNDDVTRRRERTVKRLEFQARADKLQAEYRDILDAEWDVVVHLASVVGVPNVLAAPDETLKIGWAAMMLALGLQAKKHVLASTSEVYGPDCPVTDETKPVVIPDPTAPRAAYAVSKAWAEAMLAQSGHDYVILRFHNVYGPAMGMDHVIPMFCQQLRGTDPLHVDDPTAVRAFCYIDDAVRGILAAMDLSRAIVNIGNPEEPVTMLRLMERLLRVVSDTKPIQTGATRGYPRVRIPGVARLRETGWWPTWGLDQGLRVMWEAYR